MNTSPKSYAKEEEKLVLSSKNPLQSFLCLWTKNPFSTRKMEKSIKA